VAVRRLPTELEGPVLIAPSVFADERGFFLESFREDLLAEMGIHERFVQDNHSRSRRGVVRGMHFTVGEGQAKLVRVARGRVLDVVVDIRRGSPSFGRWEAFELDDRDGRLLFVPIAFAHGFAVLSDEADVLYKCSSYYDGGLERGFAWNDPDVGIAWPLDDPVVSERDRVAPRLAEIAAELPFRYPSGVAV
jgi:dTDP-4-dehydrorhamnose 3,5-epimerase